MSAVTISSDPLPVRPRTRVLTGPGAPPERPATGSTSVLIKAACRSVSIGRRTVPLTRLGFDLLLFLAENPRRVFNRLQLLTNVWGHRHAVARTVDVHVRRLRGKVGDDVPLVTTVYGVGYRLADDASVTVDRHH